MHGDEIKNALIMDLSESRKIIKRLMIFSKLLILTPEFAENDRIKEAFACSIIIFACFNGSVL